MFPPLVRPQNVLVQVLSGIRCACSAQRHHFEWIMLLLTLRWRSYAEKLCCFPVDVPGTLARALLRPAA